MEGLVEGKEGGRGEGRKTYEGRKEEGKGR
jgi:hypothetical protein